MILHQSTSGWTLHQTFLMTLSLSWHYIPFPQDLSVPGQHYLSPGMVGKRKEEKRKQIMTKYFITIKIDFLMCLMSRAENSKDDHQQFWSAGYLWRVLFISRTHDWVLQMYFTNHVPSLLWTKIYKYETIMLRKYLWDPIQLSVVPPESAWCLWYY